MSAVDDGTLLMGVMLEQAAPLLRHCGAACAACERGAYSRCDRNRHRRKRP